MILNLNLSFGSDWKRISIIRSFITEMLSLEVRDLNDAKSISMATSELMENALKYSTIKGAVIAIKKDIDNGLVTLAMSNITTEGQLEAFKEIFEILHSDTPKEVYKQMMIRSFNQSERCQLGLARIQYECRSKLSYHVDNDLTPILKLTNTDANFPTDGLRYLTVAVEIPVTFTL